MIVRPNPLEQLAGDQINDANDILIEKYQSKTQIFPNSYIQRLSNRILIAHSYLGISKSSQNNIGTPPHYNISLLSPHFCMGCKNTLIQAHTQSPLTSSSCREALMSTDELGRTRHDKNSRKRRSQIVLLKKALGGFFA